MPRKYNQIPQVAFSILLALSLRERHGYEIIKQITDDSNGKIRLSPGALYSSITQLYEQALIREVKHPEDVRRRYYCLTDKGRMALGQELEYYENSVTLARERQVLERQYGAGYFI